MIAAPIALFAYRRARHLRETVEALAQNELATASDLYVFCDGARGAADEADVKAARRFVDTITGFKSLQVIKQPSHLGLARSIVAGVTAVCEQHGRVIVMEDDLVTSPYFLRYMNEGLSAYENDPEVVSIHGYIFPLRTQLPETFFIKGADCWGWATWKRGWVIFDSDGQRLLEELETRDLTSEFDFNGSFGYTEMLRQQIAGLNDSWAIRWYASAFLRDKLTLYPGRSLVRNIGLDGSGRHCGATESHHPSLAESPIQFARLTPREDREARRAIEHYLREN